MTVSVSEGLRAIALSDIQLSGTESQAERRKRFDKVALSELSASIKAHGVLVPVIVRPVNGHFELIAGERRYLASKTAGVDAINAHVRELTDEQALEIQLIENLQREGLHELAEAERAKAIADVAQVIVNSAKVEIQAIALIGGKGSGFIPGLTEGGGQTPARPQLVKPRGAL